MNTIMFDDYIESRSIDRAAVDAGADVLQAQLRAARLREVRGAYAMTQENVAAEMHVSQRRVSEIENGEVGKTRVDTLRRYVEALGGNLVVAATFGDTTYRIA